MTSIYNLGIGLSAVDRASPAINAVDASLNTLRGNARAAAEGGSSLADSFRDATGSGGAFTGLMRSAIGTLGRAAEQIESLSFLGETGGPALDFEDATQKMSMGLGRTSEAARSMRRDMMNLVGTTQFSIGEFVQLNQGLSQVGKSVGDFSEEVGSRMVELNQIFGVAGEDVGRMAVLTEQFGGSLVQTLDDATQFQKDFGIPGIFKELPGIVDFARESLIKYGDEATGGARAIMQNTQQMAGVYAKAFGKTISQAVSSAQETLGRFLGATRNFRRVFLGLESDFDPLTQAFQQVGVPLFQVQGLLKQAQTDVVGFAERTRGLLGNLDPWRRSRFIEQLRDELPADMMALITDTEAFNAAVREQSKVSQRQAMLSEEGSAKFKDLSTGMLDTTKEMKAMWLNMKQLIKVTMVETGLIDVLRGVFQKARDRLVEFNKGIQSFVQSDRFKSWVASVQPLLVSLGEKVLVLGTGVNELAGPFGKVAGAAGSAWFALKAFGKITGTNLGGMDKLSKLLGKVGGFFKALGGRVFGVFKKFFPLFNIVSSINTAFRDMGEVLGDPNATGMEKFAALARGTLKGVGKFFDNLLLGIPSMLLNKFFPDLERKFDVGFANLFDRFKSMDVGKAAGAVWDQFTTWLGKKLTNLDVWMASKLPDWRVMMQDWGKSIGGAIGGLAKILFDGLKLTFTTVLNPVWLAETIGGWVQSAFSQSKGDIHDTASKGIGGAMLGVLTSVTQLVVDGLQGVIDGFLGAWGTSLEEVIIRSKLAWAIVYNKGAEMFTGLTTGAKNLVDDVIGFTGDIVLGFLAGLARIPAGAKKIWTRLGNMLKSVTNTLIIDPINTLVRGAQNAFGELLSGLVKPIKDAFDNIPQVVRDKLPGISDLSTMLDNMSGAADKLKSATTSAIEPLSTLSEQGLAAEMRKIDEESRQATGRIGDVSQALNTLISDRQNARKAAKEQADEDRRVDETQLAQSLKTLETAREQRGQRATEARRFRDAQRSGYDALFAQMRRDASGKLSERQIDSAQRSLSSVLDESLRSVTSRVREGQLNVSQAQTEFNKAAQDAIKRVIRENQSASDRARRDAQRTSAGGVSERAKGPQFVGAGISPQMWQQFMANARQAGGSVQQVEVRFRGAGSDIDRIMGNRARVVSHGSGN